MSLFTMMFSGDVRKPAVKDIGGKRAVEFQLMKKNYSPAGQEATFTWIRVTVFDAKDWQVEQCQEGKFVSGYGEFTLRSYVNKEGAKVQSAEVRATSFQLDAPRTDKGEAPVAAPVKSVPPKRPAAAPKDDEIPFMRPLIADAWG